MLSDLPALSGYPVAKMTCNAIAITSEGKRSVASSGAFFSHPIIFLPPNGSFVD
jgi:hypothetical protein